MATRFHTRKHPRLKNKAIYSQPGTVVHIIIGTVEKQTYFNDMKAGRKLCEIIINTAKEYGNRLYAYCIMPDHVHILVEASEKLGIIEFVKHIKGRFRTWCRKSGKNIKLQKSFYDHVLRKDEDVHTVARYIMGNPVRAGFTERFGDYPFAGSLEFNL